ncbi:MAG TPA: iron ABC transporter permease [Anaerolineales bacterium]|nr:iron ABC transporter permease [Anaerolineales bacterium]
MLGFIPLGFLALFYFYPLAGILGLGLAEGLAGGFMLSSGMLEVLRFTLWQALLSTALTLALGLPGAYILANYAFRGKTLFRAVTAVPFVMPTLVVAAAFSALLGPTGWVNTALVEFFDLAEPPVRFVRTFPAILTAHVFYNLTIVLRLVGDFWSRLGPRLEKAAAALGANRWETFRRVTLPLLAPAIAAAGLLVFIFDFSSFAVVLILGGPRFATLEVEIFRQVTAFGNLPAAAVLSLIQLGCTLALTVIYLRFSARTSRPVDARAMSARQGRLPPAGSLRGLTLRAVLAAILLLTTAPLAALAAGSVVNLSPERTRTGALERGFTPAFYAALTSEETSSVVTNSPIQAAGVSLGFAAFTVALALLLGLPTAWVLAKRDLPALNRLIDPLLMLPLGTSAVTLGLGFIVVLDSPPFDLRTSPLLVPLAHTLVAFPFVVRSMTPAIGSIRPRLRSAAAVLGASPWQVIRTIDLPLVRRAATVAAAFAFTISLGEFGATAIVTRPQFQTIPSVIYRLLGRPGALNYGQALALSTILMLLTLGATLAIERYRSPGEEF